jgi:hypothetical protein
MEGARSTEEMSTMKVRLLAVAFGFFLVTGTAYAGPNPGGADSDGDTVENAFDNCVTASNNVQTDTDHNGCGDVCQASIICDINGDTAVGGGDLAAIGMNFGMTGCTPVTCGGADCNGDTAVGAGDLAIIGMEFGNVSGPSGITNAQCDPDSCQCTPQ